MVRFRQVPFVMVFAFVGCQAPNAPEAEGGAAAGSDPRVTLVTVEGAGMKGEATMGVTGLPHAGSIAFATLDDYLAHLKRLSVEDVAWYREVEPGIYVHEAGRQPPGMTATPRRWTRAELETRFGFAARTGE